MISDRPIFYTDIVQGTTQWLQLRSGIPTASQMDRIVTLGGKASKQAEGYMYELLAERLMKHPVVTAVTYWQDRGTQLEEDAVNFYSFTREVQTEKVGFVTNAAGTIGCSPDRLVGEDGLLEIKIPKESTQMSYLLSSGTVYDAYRVQAQAQLWVSQRKWNDILAFNPELPPALLRIERDEEFIKLLEAAVTTFSLELERQWQLCIEKGWAHER